MKRNSHSPTRGHKAVSATPLPAADDAAGPHGDPLMPHGSQQAPSKRSDPEHRRRQSKKH